MGRIRKRVLQLRENARKRQLQEGARSPRVGFLPDSEWIHLEREEGRLKKRKVITDLGEIPGKALFPRPLCALPRRRCVAEQMRSLKGFLVS